MKSYDELKAEIKAIQPQKVEWIYIKE